MPKPTFHNLPAPKQRRLVRAALEEFAARPYGEASLDRVAARARIAKGSLYQYFGGKADLYRYLVLEELGRRRAAALAGVVGGTLFERLEAMFIAGLTAFGEDPKAAALGARIHEEGGDAAARALKRELRERAVTELGELLRAAVERGEVRADLDLDVAARLVATVAGPGLVDALCARLGKTVAQLASGRVAVDRAVVTDTVRATMEMLAHGLAVPTKEGARR